MSLDFHHLTPDVMLDALAEVGLAGDGRMLALSSYENRVVRLHLDDAHDGADSVVVKFYRPERWSDAAIAEEHEFANALAQAEVPVLAPLRLKGQTLHHHGGFAFSVSPWCGGRRPDLENPGVLGWLGRLMARLHQVGAAAPFAQRGAISPDSLGHASRAALLNGQHLPLEIERNWLRACDAALQAVDQIWRSSPHQSLRLHGDCHPGNILWDPDRGPHFVDLDDTRSGPAVQDLWMLVSGGRASQTQQLALVLEGYEQLRDFDRRQLALIEPLRTLRLIHYSAWLAARRDDPAFAHNFPWFGTLAYWQEQVSILVDQIDAMAAPALTV